MDLVLFIITNLLRLFGLFWIFGGTFVCVKVIRLLQLDNYIKQIDCNYHPYSQDDVFGFSIGLLTLLSGVTLVFKQDLAIVFLGLLIILQLMFFKFRENKLKSSQNDKDKEYYSIAPQTYNAYLTSIYVAIFTVIKYIFTII